MKRSMWTGVLLPLALVLAACGGASPGSTPGGDAPPVQGLVKNGDGYVDISVDQLAGLLEKRT
jgi:hypothetical protein